MNSYRQTRLIEIHRDIGRFSRFVWPNVALRPYQARVAREIASSVLSGEGRQFAIVFARQSGKDETLAQLEAYLMFLHRLRGGSVLVGQPHPTGRKG